MIQKMSILHCVYQMIISADESTDGVQYSESVETALIALDLPNNAWENAIRLNTYDSFTHISGLKESEKILFKNLILKIANMGENSFLRVTCANHILQLSNCHCVGLDDIKSQ